MIKLSNFTKDAIATMIISGVIIMGTLYWQATHKDTLAGYTEGTDGYFGYLFARDNDLKSKAECEYAKLPPSSPEETSAEFMQGCHKYFEN